MASKKLPNHRVRYTNCSEKVKEFGFNTKVGAERIFHRMVMDMKSYKQISDFDHIICLELLEGTRRTQTFELDCCHQKVES